MLIMRRECDEVTEINQTSTIKVAAAIGCLIHACEVDKVGQVNLATCVGVRARCDDPVARPKYYALSRSLELKTTVNTITTTEIVECHRARARYISCARLSFLARAETVTAGNYYGLHQYFYAW